MKKGRVPPRTVTSRDELFWRPKQFRSGNANDIEMGHFELATKRMMDYEAEKREQAAIGPIVPARRRTN